MTVRLVLRLPIDQFKYLLLMTIKQGRLLVTTVVLHLPRIAICDLLRPLSPYKMFRLVWVLQTEIQCGHLRTRKEEGQFVFHQTAGGGH
jgi:hypothetical protein